MLLNQKNVQKKFSQKKLESEKGESIINNPRFEAHP
jgi:hypothetical protein